MADPTPYAVSYSFSGFQASSPTTPLPAPKVDAEFANVAAAVAGLVASVKDVRRSDGALKNGIVTLDSFALGLQLTVDPTNGNLVVAAVAGAQASATAASGSATAAGTSATNSAASAAAAATSAATVNLSLYLAKANNLAGLGSNDTALANIGAAKVDGSTLTGRLAAIASVSVADWNNVLASGWYFGNNAANSPAAGQYLVETIANNQLYILQFAYPFTNASTSTSAVLPSRRVSFDSGGGVIAWQPWETIGYVPTGTTIWVNGTTPPPGYLKENGALVSRASFPALTAFALASGNIVSEATWLAGSTGAFSTGDLSTTFRIPDARGEFIRAFDDGRGVDTGRVLEARTRSTYSRATNIRLSVRPRPWRAASTT